VEEAVAVEAVAVVEIALPMVLEQEEAEATPL
jgi:hypothetical protein